MSILQDMGVPARAILLALVWFIARETVASSPTAISESDMPALEPGDSRGVKTRVTGRVVDANGSAVPNAVIVTAHGGNGLSDADGAFSFEVLVPRGEAGLGVTAVATVDSVNLTGSTFTRTLGRGPRGTQSAELGLITMSAGAACGEVAWIPVVGPTNGIDGTVRTLAVFDDGGGGGPALYVGGQFQTAGGVIVNRIARWDGSGWSALGGGISSGVVHALAVFDDGAGPGPALYVGGDFTSAGGVPVNNIARWDGSRWSTLAGGLNGTVLALAACDGGGDAEPALYVGGGFTEAGGVPSQHIARWDGGRWSALGHGVNGSVHALVIFDDGLGGGPALHAGGIFTTAGGASANRIARWHGDRWSSLGSGTSGIVSALAGFDDGGGGGPALYAGGSFRTAGGIVVNSIARWDGIGWSALGGGVNGPVRALAAVDGGDDGGPKLYAGGEFTSAGGTSARRLAGWDGIGWSALGTGVDQSIFALAEFAVDGEGDTGGSALHAAGLVTFDGVVPSNFIARWDGRVLSTLGRGVNTDIQAMMVFDDGRGGGPALYVGGYFTAVGGIPANHIARWDGRDWSPLGSGLDGAVRAMAVFDDGSGRGPALYVGGGFDTAGDQEAGRIARWDGSTWSSLDGGVNGYVASLMVADLGDGEGPGLIVAGGFGSVGGIDAENIARWDGTRWSALGPGVNGIVYALAAFDDGRGDGPAVYAGGDFSVAGGEPASNIARWDGRTWSTLHGGVNSRVYALCVFDDGSGFGPALYAGGRFSLAGGVPASYIARWNGLGWSALGSGLNFNVWALAAFDDGSGSGPALYVGGEFDLAGGVPAERIARWNGGGWAGLDSGMNGYVIDLAVFDADDGRGPALYAGGGFTESAAGDAFLTRWGCPPPPPPPPPPPGDLTGDGVVGLGDLLVLLGFWGACGECSACPPDFDGDCVVDFGDLLVLLQGWS